MGESESLVDVTLFLRGDLLDPAQATSMLGIAGSKMHSKGEKWRTSTNHEVTAKTGLWSLHVQEESRSLSDQIAWLRRNLRLATCPLLQIPGVQEAELSVFIALGSNDRGGGDYESQLTPDDLMWLGTLGVPVTFELTFVKDESRRQGKKPGSE
jgi:hypothetical protein